MQITHSRAQCPVHVITPPNFCSPDIDTISVLACCIASFCMHVVMMQKVPHLLCLPALLPGRGPSMISSSCSAHIISDTKSEISVPHSEGAWWVVRKIWAKAPMTTGMPTDDERPGSAEVVVAHRQWGCSQRTSQAPCQVWHVPRWPTWPRFASLRRVTCAWRSSGLRAAQPARVRQQSHLSCGPASFHGCLGGPQQRAARPPSAAGCPLTYPAHACMQAISRYWRDILLVFPKLPCSMLEKWQGF